MTLIEFTLATGSRVYLNCALISCVYTNPHNWVTVVCAGIEYQLAEFAELQDVAARIVKWTGLRAQESAE
jgi:hypothetical protein